jgi:hypothetical protein
LFLTFLVIVLFHFTLLTFPATKYNVFPLINTFGPAAFPVTYIETLSSIFGHFKDYYLNGNTQLKTVRRTCQSGGKWSGNEPICEGKFQYL